MLFPLWIMFWTGIVIGSAGVVLAFHVIDAFGGYWHGSIGAALAGALIVTGYAFAAVVGRVLFQELMKLLEVRRETRRYGRKLK